MKGTPKIFFLVMLMTTPAKMKMRMMTMAMRIMTVIIAWEGRDDGKGAMVPRKVNICGE